MTSTRDGLNRAFQDTFQPGRLTVGVFVAIESYAGAIPSMTGQLELAQHAETLGYAALWVRDVPLLDVQFGDAGQVYDPYVWLGQVSAVTDRIALGTAGLVLPVRHPLHVAKAAASIDVLTSGRMLLGLSSGDRPVEYPAFGRDFETRGEAFRRGVGVVREALSGRLSGMDGSVHPIPVPADGGIGMLSVGSAQQELSWLARNLDGYITYPRRIDAQRRQRDAWSAAVAGAPGEPSCKPFAQSLYIDLLANQFAGRYPIHLGYRLGARALREYLLELRDIGVNHVILNLKYGSRPAVAVLDEIAESVLPALA
jgi:luciferase-type oxidoreductase